MVQNKGVNLTLLLMLVLSAFLMATGSMVMERLVGAVDQLFDVAKPPHFLQMHKGEYDEAALERFAAAHPEIDSWLIEEMLGFDGASLAWERPSTGESGDLSSRLIDNLFVTQNEEFDFLIDETGAIPEPAVGEVYLPVGYQQSFDLQAGDELRIRTESGIRVLRIEGFVRDAQMASLLSSTRFLVSTADFEALAAAGGGTPEIIVEYRLDDPGTGADFQRVYEADAAVPKNGQGVTYEQIRLINAFSDGLVALALVFVSMLVMVIALLNVRFVIRGMLTDEVREIGAMKAIGLPDRMISGLYLLKYRAMTLSACLVGGAAAVVATHLLTGGIEDNYAEAEIGPATFLVPTLALSLVYLFVVGICRRVLGRVRRIEVVNALVHGSTLDERQTARRARRQARRVRRGRLDGYRGGNLNRRLAMLELRSEARSWLLIPLVFCLASILMTLPMNLYTTFDSSRFGTYLGVPDSELRVDLQFSDGLDALRGDVLTAMGNDDRLTGVESYANLTYRIEGDEGWETFRVEVGDYTQSTIEYIRGGRPGAGQIAVSALNAERYRLSPGDVLAMRLGDDEVVSVEVSGVYQDLTGGGYTAKMHGEVTADAAAYVVFADIVGGGTPAAIASEYGGRFPNATVLPTREYMKQTLSYAVDSFRGAALLALVSGVAVAALITSMFLKLRLASDRRRMGMLSAIGFSARELRNQVQGNALVAIATGVVAGAVLSATVGESMVGSLIAMAGLGITDLSFIPNPLLVYVAYPLLLIATGYLSTVFLTAGLRGADKSGWLTS
ncbi:FtsX-like permease family protein [Stackebrandtia albiflava]|nr:FtsX-like permease family protein [Stackebrandtia albiflava]